MKKLLFVFFVFMFMSVNAQEHTASLKYTIPSDQLVRAKLSQWGKIELLTLLNLIQKNGHLLQKMQA